MATLEMYVKDNWDKLPHSTFNEDECVIVQTICDSSEGWGHHSYSGIGVNKDGTIVYCYSSGCSCSGSCGVEHKKDFKVLEADVDVSALNPDELNFEAMQVSFSDYE